VREEDLPKQNNHTTSREQIFDVKIH